MNKAAIGALAMVLVGSVTFSLTNTLLTDHSTKKRMQTHNTTILADQKSVDESNQTDKTATEPTPAPDEKNVQTADSLLASVTQVESNNGNASEQPAAVNQNNTVQVSSPAPSPNTTASTIPTTPKTNTPSAGTTSTAPAVTPAPTTNQNPAPASTTSNAPVTAPAQATSTNTTTINHGQQVSQAAKEKGAAASQQNKKVTN